MNSILIYSRFRFQLGFASASSLVNLFVLSIFSVNAFAQLESYTCYTPEVATSSSAVSCNDLDHFKPDETTSVLIVRLAFHVLQREAPLPKGNFNENDPDDVAFLVNVFDRLNTLYNSGNEQWCNCSWVETDQTRDSKIQFELDGIYYHRDDVGYVNGDGTYSSSYNYDNFASCRDEVLNVFFSNPPLATASGVSTTSYVGMFNFYDEYQQGNGNPWGTGNLLGHEIGHTFGLFIHSFCVGGRFSDMCQSENQNCVANFCANTSSDCSCGNNMMSYSRLADYISPLQMATMRRRLTLVESSSKFLKLELQQTPIVIDQSGVEWEEARILHNDVFILPGASLRITCRVVMAKNARIVVRRGARLIVDGGVITSKGPTATDCNGDEILEFIRWRGIEVWGNTSVSPSSAMLSESFPLQTTDPGVVILKNNALIEHATIGIFPQQRGTTWEEQLEHFGGLIHANNAEFRDCWKGVEYISHFPIRSSSRFINTRFTQTYIGTALPFPIETNLHGLTSWQVNDISFNDCDFLNLKSGLTFLNADFTIENSLFRRNNQGIYIGAITPGLSLLTEIGDYSNGNIFENCKHPISIFAYDLVEIDDNTILSCPNGIYLEGPCGAIIQNNELRNDIVGNNPDMGRGITLTQTGEGIRNLIRCNEWISIDPPPSSPKPLTLIRDGILVHGNNKTTLFYDNKFHCKYDTKILQFESEDENEEDVPGMLPNQILGPLSNAEAVFNEFTDYSLETHSAEIHTPNPFNPDGPLTLPFIYLHPQGICPNPPALGSQYIPRRPVSGTCSVSESSFNFRNSKGSGSTQLTCPVIPRPTIVLNSECKTLPCLEDLYPDIAQYKSILQDGDENSLYTSIKTNPNGSSTLSALDNASPWLSDGVLHEVLSSALTESNKLNVLRQNIPLPIHILAQVETLLSIQGYNYIVGLHSVELTSARDSILGNLISLTNYKDALLRHIVDSLVLIEEFSEASDLLTTDGGRFARESLVGIQIAKGDFTEAKELLSTWSTSEKVDEEFSTIHDIYINFAMEGSLPSSIDSSELMDIAIKSPHQAARAKVLLGVLYGILFEPLLPNEEFNYAFSNPSIPIAFKPTFDVTNPTFELYPNPTDNVLLLYIENEATVLEENGLITISIFDTKGSRLDLQYILAAQATIDVSHLPQGVYVITAHTGKQYLGVKRFIKH